MIRFFGGAVFRYLPEGSGGKEKLCGGNEDGYLADPKKNIHLIISALMSAPSCLVMRRVVRSCSCELWVARFAPPPGSREFSSCS